jgi:hypothetical protein
MRWNLLAGSCLFLATSLAAALCAARGETCCMVPRDYPGDVDQSLQEALIVHADGHEELVLRVRPFFPEAAEPPAFLAWLVTVPSPPSAYRTAAPGIFESARGLHERLQALYDAQKPQPFRIAPSLGASVESAAPRQAQGLEINAPVTVGPYTITEVRTRGAEAVEELNRYLAENEFGTEDPDHLRWFAENDFTFLCIRIEPPPGALRLGTHLELDPLQIGFASERPYYPGKYSANQGNFGLGLSLLTPGPLARDALRAVRGRLQGWGGTPNLFTVQPLDEPLQAVLDEGFGGAAPTPERWYVNRVDSSGFNRPDNAGTPAILKWADDVFWALGSAADGPPAWYFGDGERPWTHPRNTRRMWGALVILAVAVLGFWLLARARQARAA